MPDEEQQWQRLVAGLRGGERQIVDEFWGRYGPLMHQVAEQHLSPQLRRRVGAEDVVQSVCRTFFRRVRGGEFALPDSEALWRLLCAITLTKVREQSRFHGRAKRGMQREIAMAGPSDDTSSGVSQYGQARGPTPAEAAEFSEQFQNLIQGLGEEEKQLVYLKLDALTNEQAAQKLGCSERTVRRLVKQLQDRLSALL
jgi:RNA polymerase sigma factor (sigma-70 family)